MGSAVVGAIAGTIAVGDGPVVCAVTTLNDNSSPNMKAQRIGPKFSLVQYQTQNQEELLVHRKVQLLNNIAAELTDKIADCRAAQRCAEGFGDLAATRVLVWIVGDR